MIQDIYNSLIIGESNYYEQFYILAFILSNLILIIGGHRRGFPLYKWFTLLLFTSFFFLIGTKVFVLDLTSFLSLITHGTIPQVQGRSALGGLLLGGLSLYIGMKALKLNGNVLDVYALSLPISLGVQKLGCFSAGCCYGVESTAFWGVRYPANTMAHFNHYLMDLIPLSEPYSKLVHPVQLYEFFAGLLVFAIVYSLRNRWSKHGVLFSLSIGLYALIRFGNEFLRDPMGHPTGGKVSFLFSNEQWVLLFISILSIYWFIVNRNKEEAQVEYNTYQGNLELKKVYLLIITVVLSFVVFYNLFSYLEIYALLSLIIPSIVFFIRSSIAAVEISLYNKLAFIAPIIIIPLIVIGQTIPKNDKELEQESYYLLKTAYGQGDYWTSKELDNIPKGSCGPVNQHGFNEKYNIYSLGLAKITNVHNENVIYGYGTDIFYGKHNEAYFGEHTKANSIFNVNPYFQVYSKWIGAKVGLHIGNLIIADGHTKASVIDNRDINHLKRYVMPQASISLFPRKYFFIEYSFFDLYPSSFPAFRHTFSVGSAFGYTNGLLAKVGLHSSGSYYGSINIPIGKKFMIESMYSTSEVHVSDYSLNIDERHRNNHFSIGLQYKFGYKEKKRPQSEF